MEQTLPFGAWLRQRRKALDLTRTALADQVGCSAATIAKIEEGQRRPSAQVAERLARALTIADDERAAFVRLARAVDHAAPALPAREPQPLAPLAGSPPQPLAPLHGRDELLAQVGARLLSPATRLLSLTGPPGVGKTRLAIALAQRAGGAFPGGVAFVPLAAVRDPALALDAIALALEQSLSVSGAGLRDLPDRQRSLHAALDWSYDLLEAGEQRLLARLGVFAGSWTLDAAEAICATDDAPAAPDSTRAALAALVDKSLVQRSDGAGDDVALFSMLVVVREYVRERGRASGAEPLLRERHARYYALLAERSAPLLTGPAQRQTIARLRAAHPDLSAALGYLFDAQRYEEAAQMATALRRFWWMTAFLPQGRRWLHALAQHLDALALPTRADVCNALGMLLSGAGEIAASCASFEAALTYARHSEDEARIGVALHNLSSTLGTLGKYDPAAALLEEALELDRDSGDRWGLAMSLCTLGGMHYHHGKWGAAHAAFEESLALVRAVGDQHSVALTLNNLGETARRQGDYDGAQAFLAEALAVALVQESRLLPPFVLNNQAQLALQRNELPQARQMLAQALAMLRSQRDAHELVTNLRACALYAALRGEPAAAAQLLGAAAGLGVRNGIRDGAGARDDIAAVEALARAPLAEERWHALWALGQALGDEAALAAALAALHDG